MFGGFYKPTIVFLFQGIVLTLKTETTLKSTKIESICNYNHGMRCHKTIVLYDCLAQIFFKRSKIKHFAFRRFSTFVLVFVVFWTPNTSLKPNKNVNIDATNTPYPVAMPYFTGMTHFVGVTNIRFVIYLFEDACIINYNFKMWSFVGYQFYCFNKINSNGYWAILKSNALLYVRNVSFI